MKRALPRSPRSPPSRRWRCPPPAAGAQRRAAPAQRDWTQIAVRTPEGGFRMGNPNAPVKLIEYLSLDLPALRRLRARRAQPRLFEPMSAPAGSASNIATIVLNGSDARRDLAQPAAPRRAPISR